jgi:hypothetical protein
VLEERRRKRIRVFSLVLPSMHTKGLRERGRGTNKE